MKLLTEPILKSAKNQYHMGDDFKHEGKDQMVVAKFFNPLGNWKWFLMNIHPDFDPVTTPLNTESDYAWGIVSGFEVEMGSFSMVELQTVDVGMGLRVERDLMFDSMKASELWEQLHAGEYI